MTQRGLTPVLTGVVFLVLAMAWNHATGTAFAASAAGALQDGGSCPLSVVKQTKASKAWLKMMPVFRHPRCLNCHGGIPDPIGTPRRGPPRRHVGVVDIEPSAGFSRCEDCHMKGWEMPVPFFFWTDKSDEELCSFMKSKFSAAKFVDHIRRDLGGTQFIAAAFRGDRSLDAAAQAIYEGETGKTFKPEPPPGSHAQLTQMAMDWVAAQGGSFVGDDKCGCVPPELGETYLLEIKQTDNRAFSGFVVTDQVTMKVRVEDTTVTVSALTNFPSAAAPEMITTPSATISWVPDPVGIQNIVQVTGEIALDFPTEGVRTLMLHFTHRDTRDPQFLIVSTNKPYARSNVGGTAINGMPMSIQFGLLPGQKASKVYETGKKDLMEGKLTLTKAPTPK